MKKRDVSVLLIVILAAGIFAVTMYFGVVTLFDKTWFSPDEGGGDPTLTGQPPPTRCYATYPIKLELEDAIRERFPDKTVFVFDLLGLVPSEKQQEAYNEIKTAFDALSEYEATKKVYADLFELADPDIPNFKRIYPKKTIEENFDLGLEIATSQCGISPNSRVNTDKIQLPTQISCYSVIYEENPVVFEEDFGLDSPLPDPPPTISPSKPKYSLINIEDVRPISFDLATNVLCGGQEPCVEPGVVPIRLNAEWVGNIRYCGYTGLRGREGRWEKMIWGIRPQTRIENNYD